MKKVRDQKTYYELCKNLQLEEYDADSYVFNYGDVGSHFYIIIEGSVNVMVPMPIELE